MTVTVIAKDDLNDDEEDPFYGKKVLLVLYFSVELIMVVVSLYQFMALI